MFRLGFVNSRSVIPPARPVVAAVARGTRSLGSKSKPPGTDPLDLLKKECLARNLCDNEGGRLPGSHWVFVTSIANDSGPAKVSPSLYLFAYHRSSQPMIIRRTDACFACWCDIRSRLSCTRSAAFFHYNSSHRTYVQLELNAVLRLGLISS